MQWDSIIPIYRDLSESMNWFSDFAQYIKPRKPHLPSRMLYYGPGLSDAWLKSASVNDANAAQMRAFERSFSEIIDKHLLDHNGTAYTTIVDLGIGDFSKGSLVVESLLEYAPKYIALDVSYEMVATTLSVGIGRGARVLKELRQNSGNVVGINARFEHLQSYRHLFSRPGSNLFLLLGNTLGNEMSERETLKDISIAMGFGDLLITEVQLREEQPFTEDELTVSIQGSANFYVGPFLALGCSLENIDLFVREDKNSKEALTYEIVCSFRKDTEIDREPLKMTIPGKKDIPVYVVRKYNESSLDADFKDAGLRIIDKFTSSGNGERSRRFCLIVAKKER